MTPSPFVVLIAVAIAFLVLMALVRRYPLKVRQHWVECPQQDKPFLVEFIRREIGWGNFRVSDVATCTAFPSGEVTCDKECMKRFPIL